ncbi:response regulator transcription factor [Streptomyces sp. NPDC089919]|uniref:response regulator transcription factor n=1 Tax=Streptomyces sp. NPDC089919 TaxID=3155188 RepID=UPI00341B3B5B
MRVVVVDDEALMRSGLEMILGSAPGIEVLGACEGPAALRTVTRHRPDVVLLDIRMPGLDGLAVLAQLSALPDPPVVAMLTAFASDEYVHTAMHQGAAGYLLKDTDPDQLVREVRALAAGGRPLSPAVTPVVIEGYLAHGAGTRGAAREVAALSPRERQVLALLGQGLTNARIAQRLHLAPSTVKDHLSALMGKLRCGNRVQAAVVAERAGLLHHTSAGP